MSGAAPASALVSEAPALQDRDVEPRTPMKRLGSTRKLAAFSNIRIQLSEQTRVLEARAEATAGVAGELHDYCRRRADLEHEYSRALDKLARAAHQRHKDQKHKREQWPLTGAFACWQAALESTRALSRDHASLGELYGGPLAARLQRAADDALRLHRKCKDIVAERHEEVGQALAEAGAAGKAHAAAAAEWRAAALKLRRAHDQRLRLLALDPPRHKKIKALDKELDKRRARHSEARVRALRARADYALSLEAANATLQRYYLDDIADIMLCAEVGFGAVVSRAAVCAGAAEAARGRAALTAGAALRAAGLALDAHADRTRTMDHHAPAFQLPAPLPYQGAPASRQVLGRGRGRGRGRAALTAGAALRAAGLALDAHADRTRTMDHHAPAFQLPAPLPYQGAPASRQVLGRGRGRGRGRAALTAGAALRAAGLALDAHADRTRTMDHHAPAFQLPAPLPYQGAPASRQDAEMQTLVEGAVEQAAAEAEAGAARSELAARLLQLQAAARLLHAECSEAAKTLDAAEAELLRQIEGSDEQWDVSGLFGENAARNVGALAAAADDPEPRRDQEDYYLAKFRAYVSCAGRLARVEARAAAARARLGDGAGAGADTSPPPPPPSPPRRAAARARRDRFAAPLDDRLPLVLTSCVRVIATYGLKHQGIFRVSGSQVEMQSLRAAFERGEDPLAGARDASDVNSVCGLLKLFLRELRPPPLPPRLHDSLTRLAAAPDDDNTRRRLRAVLAALPAPNMLLLRYLFAFLAHLTEYSEYNMMDAWNLAICLGPTLLAAWGEGGAQVTAQNLVNELVKRVILHHHSLFPQDIAPHTLYTRQFPSAEESDEPDSRDDLSLYDDDDDDISEDGESGEWQDSNSTENRSRPSPRPRPRPKQTCPPSLRRTAAGG
ncbi:unnamed protein product [Chilo suppressalis]|uniref:Rho-GAP domain-containing protein n=1 Tax=Chilo suppressalis TaxID=168631 RepID=A0ABN8L6H7_CHISP|nr:unnamed protein product [Chilo suppressalis]